MEEINAQHQLSHSSLTSTDLKNAILTWVEDKKGEDLVILNLKEKTNIADYFIIVTASSGRQGGAIADFVSQKLKELGVQPRVEGVSQGDWILVDAGDVILHVFRPEIRSLYALEKMWGDGNHFMAQG